MVWGLEVSAVVDRSDGSSKRTTHIRFFSVPLDGGNIGGRGATPDGPGAASIGKLTKTGTGGSRVPSVAILKVAGCEASLFCTSMLLTKMAD